MAYLKSKLDQAERQRVAIEYFDDAKNGFNKCSYQEPGPIKKRLEGWFGKWLGMDFFRSIKHVELDVEMLPRLKDMQGVKEVLLRSKGRAINDDDIKRLTLSPTISELVILGDRFENEITDAGLKIIAESFSLTGLTFYNCTRVTSQGLRPLASQVGLQSFTCSDSKLDDDCFEMAKRWPKLRFLYIGSDNITDAGVLRFCQLPQAANLTSILLWSEHLTGASLRELSKLKSIDHLSLASQLNDDDMEFVASMKSLRFLYLFNNRKITDQGICKLNKLTDLEDLNLSCTGISDEGLMSLTALPKLRTILTKSTQVTAEGRARYMKQFPAVKVY
jgi:hypothetical protein